MLTCGTINLHFAEEIDLYRWLVDHIENFPTEITLVLPKLLEGKIDAKPLIDGSTLSQVRYMKNINLNYKFSTEISELCQFGP